ncbi:hypothetical protein K9M47_02090 [Candidatus Gracilibacteria bacterium]|nr:hypothetical protein [Candidatus Gracilibacteria bacterium]MCF7898895.1 hypothetical protein [Candidatus Paceibacterota bacterium]
MKEKKEENKIKIISLKDHSKEKDQKSKTQEEIRLGYYIKELLRSAKFKKDLEDLKNRYDIPVDGFGKEDGEINLTTLKQYSNSDIKNFNKEFLSILNKYGINKGIAPTWVNIIYSRTLYGNLMTPHDLYSVFGEPEYGMVDVLDISDLLDPTLEGKTYEDAVNYFKEITYGKPVAILINPYASERNILDSIKKIYKTSILPIQNLHKNQSIKIGKIKKKDPIIEKRKDFIYKNKDLPRKEIMLMVTDKFGKGYELDYANIGKIISLEKKRLEG